MTQDNEVCAMDERTEKIIRKIRTLKARRSGVAQVVVLPRAPASLRIDVVQEKHVQLARLRQAFDEFWTGSAALPSEFRDDVNDLEGAFRVIGERVQQRFRKVLGAV